MRGDIFTSAWVGGSTVLPALGPILNADNMSNGERVRYSSDLCRLPQVFKMIARLVFKIFAVIHRVCCHSLSYIRSLRSSIERGRE